jgi:galacturan 1,4-alpha-galacturonidase
VITGERIHINGYGTGGIFGNGNAWYNDEKAVTQPGRPMPFVFWNVSDVFVEHCEHMSPVLEIELLLTGSVYVKDPPLWSLNIMNGTNMAFDDIYCNATAVNAPYGTNWVQNTDGFNTSKSVSGNTNGGD